MIFFIGSTNPVKINAVKLATQDYWPQAKLLGFEVDSQVSEQPHSDQETKLGAINRAKAALKIGKISHQQELKNNQDYFGVGLEGGVMMINDQMWTTIWVTVIDKNNKLFLANGGRFLVPEFLANQINQGEEMGPALSKYFNGRSVKTQEGLVGIVTNNYLDRAELYSAIVKLAIGQWYGQNWQDQLDI